MDHFGDNEPIRLPAQGSSSIRFRSGVRYMETQEYRPKGLLYHYTSADGLIGILKSGHIFATHIRYLNDSQEMLDSLSHLEGFLEGFDPDVRPHLKRFLESSVRVFACGAGAYVVSFTDDAAALVGTEQLPGDRLNQWRAYSRPGKGFSLGFDPRVIDEPGKGEILEGIDLTAYLQNCIYDRPMKRWILGGAGGDLVEELQGVLQDLVLSDMKRAMHRWHPTMSEEFFLSEVKGLMESREIPQELRGRLRDVRMRLMAAISLNATTLKNEAFFEEKEWRIVVLGRHPVAEEPLSRGTWNVKFRDGALGLTPYIEFPLHLNTAHSPLRKIVAGPTAHMDDAVQAVKKLLDELGIRQRSDDYPDGVEVVPSQIPFRYW